MSYIRNRNWIRSLYLLQPLLLCVHLCVRAGWIYTELVHISSFRRVSGGTRDFLKVAPKQNIHHTKHTDIAKPASQSVCLIFSTDRDLVS